MKKQLKRRLSKKRQRLKSNKVCNIYFHRICKKPAYYVSAFFIDIFANVDKIEV